MVSGSLELSAQGKVMTRTEYINKYKDIAISEMKRTGVPASIKLAQGMLESGNGNSTLAVKGNNHFGIKCHNNWKGKGIRHNDDKKRECFRRYKHVEESFIDHSDFLSSTSRYAFLFDLEPTDYKGWARGLKKAGYATSPTYAEALIRIIEENELFVYDLTDMKKRIKDEPYRIAETAERTVYQRNRVKYIISREGDSFESIRKEMKLLPFQLFKYNELEQGDSIYPGQVLYIQPKRNRAEAGNNYHIVKEGEKMHDISQQYAIKLDKLYEKNLMEYGTEPDAGKKLSLRKNLKGENFPEPKGIKEKPVERKKIEFEFID